MDGFGAETRETMVSGAMAVGSVAAAAAEPPRTDAFGVALPSGAVARLAAQADLALPDFRKI